MVAARDGAAVAVHPRENAAASPLRYEIDAREQHPDRTAIEDAGSTSARSTTRTPARTPAVADGHQPLPLYPGAL